MIVNKLYISAIILFILSYFHTLRNINSAYIFILIISIGVFSLICINSKNNCFNEHSFLIFALFVSYSLATINSIIFNDFYRYLPNAVAVGIFRLWFSFPIIIACAILARIDFKFAINFILYFFVLASFSYFYQIVNGPISWFAEYSERAGQIRYASLAGSLTTYGVYISTPALIACALFNGSKRILFLLILFSGAVISLQKAALANIVLALIISLWFGWIRISFKNGAIFILIILTLYFMPNMDESINSYIKILDAVLSGDNDVTSDVPFFESVYDRLTALPAKAINYFSPYQLIVGVGIYGASGALGYPDIPMAHNGLVELILVFGFLPGGLLILCLLYLFAITSFIIINRRKSSVGLKLSASILFLWILNFVFSGGGFFHPIGSSIFWLSFFYIILNRRKKFLTITNF
jgi:hypothetical protein